MRRCHNCGAEWDSEKREPGVKEFCSQCDAWLHCCLNCRFYDPSVSQQCRNPTVEYVADKAAANFCGEFEFAETAPPRAQGRDGDSARDAFGDLFGEHGESTGPPDEGHDAFRRLFGEE
ncbi:MAG: hypothetical protein ACLFU6_02685 [Candidatus Hydrogenedentota bacterium]